MTPEEPLTEEKFVVLLDDVIDETLDLKKGERVLFCNALAERLREDHFFTEDEEDEYEEEPESEDDV